MSQNYIKSLKVDEHAWETITSETPQALSQGVWQQSSTHLGKKNNAPRYKINFQSSYLDEAV